MPAAKAGVHNQRGQSSIPARHNDRYLKHYCALHVRYLSDKPYDPSADGVLNLSRSLQDIIVNRQTQRDAAASVTTFVVATGNGEGVIGNAINFPIVVCDGELCSLFGRKCCFNVHQLHGQGLKRCAVAPDLGRSRGSIPGATVPLALRVRQLLGR